MLRGAGMLIKKERGFIFCRKECVSDLIGALRRKEV